MYDLFLGLVIGLVLGNFIGLWMMREEYITWWRTGQRKGWNDAYAANGRDRPLGPGWVPWVFYDEDEVDNSVPWIRK